MHHQILYCIQTQGKVQNPDFVHGKVCLNKKVNYGYRVMQLGLVQWLIGMITNLLQTTAQVPQGIPYFKFKNVS